MNDLAHSVDIDRIILTDVDVAPDRAERIRALVEMALQHLLAQEGWTHDLTDSAVNRVEVPALELSETGNDNDLANELALRIVLALSDRGRRKGV